MGQNGAPHPCQHLVLSEFWIWAILIGVEWRLVSLMTDGVEHLFIGLFVICTSSSVKCLFKSLAHFLLVLFVSISRSCRFCPVLSSRRFPALHFTFMSVIHFELIFVKGVRSGSRIIFHVDVQLFQHHWLKRLSFPIALLLLLLQKFLGSLFCSIDTFVCSFTNTTLFWFL